MEQGLWIVLKSRMLPVLPNWLFFGVNLIQQEWLENC